MGTHVNSMILETTTKGKIIKGRLARSSYFGVFKSTHTLDVYRDFEPREHYMYIAILPLTKLSTLEWSVNVVLSSDLNGLA